MKRIELPALPEDAVEVLSVFRMPDGSLMFCLDPTLDGGAEGPGVWGIVLVDLAHHVAHAATQLGVTRERALGDIYEMLQAEWEDRTDKVGPYPEGAE